MDEKLVKKQLFYSRLTAIFTGIMAATVLTACLILVPKAMNTINRADGLIEDVRNTVANADAALADVDTMAVSITQAAEELNTVDFEGLNNAIGSLEDAAGSFSDVMGGFKIWVAR